MCSVWSPLFIVKFLLTLQGKATTTTTTEAPAEYDDEEVEEGVEEAVTTTTEAPKRAGVRTGVVRPFRSNTDLIESLKRRRQQQHNAPATTSAPAPPPPERTSKRRPQESDQTGSTSDNAYKATRKFSGRSKSVVKTEAPASEAPEPSTTPKNRAPFGRQRKL